MNDSSIETAQAIVAEVRRSFHVFKAFADMVHAELGISGGRRAVLEELARSGPATVSDMARKKRVVRQHIQALTDELKSLKLVEERENPRHRRSPLIALTRKGEMVCAAIAEREAPVWERLAAVLDPRKAAMALQTLAALRESVEVLIREHPKGGVGK